MKSKPCPKCGKETITVKVPMYVAFSVRQFYNGTELDETHLKREVLFETNTHNLRRCEFKCKDCKHVWHDVVDVNEW